MADPSTDTIEHAGYMGRDQHYERFLQHYNSVNSVTIPKEYFEQMHGKQYAAQNALRHTMGNPFPMALMGFLIASTPLGCTLMGWRGAGGQGAALVGLFYFFGGMLQIIGSVMEWIIGETFPCVVFASYGAFWLSLGATFTPFYDAKGAYYNSSETGNVLAMGKAEYYNTYAFFFMIITVLTFFYIIAAFRTNVVVLITIFFIDMAFFMLMSSYWVAAEGRAGTALNLQIAAGAFVFTFCMSGWYLFLSLILSALDFPFTLPLGDLTTRIPSMKDREAKKLGKTGEKSDDGANGTSKV